MTQAPLDKVLTPQPRILFPIGSIEYESLFGYVRRAAGHNYLTWADLTEGVRLRPIWEESSDSDRTLRLLAHRLRIPVANLRKLATAVQRGPTEKEIDFHGIVLPKVAFDFSRRVSPASLAVSEHHRAAWLLAGVGFCVETWTYLIAKCPNPECAKRLDWRRGFEGVANCGYCSLDLRQATSVFLPEEERVALGFAAGLVSPDISQRREALGAVPAQFQGLAPRVIFELVQAFGRATFPSDQYVSEGDEPAKYLKPGAELMLTYPASFERLIPQGSAINSKADPFFSALRRIARTKVRPATAAALTSIIDIHLGQHVNAISRLRESRRRLGMLTLKEAARRLKVDNSKARILCNMNLFRPHPQRGERRIYEWFHLEEVDMVVRELENRVSDQSFMSSYGLSVPATQQLLSLKLIELNESAAVEVTYKRLQFTKNSVDQLTACLVRSALREPSERMVPLRHAFLGLGAMDRPWGPVIAAAVNGILPGGFALLGDGPLASRMAITEELSNAMISSQLGGELGIYRFDTNLYPMPFREEMTGVEVHEYLNCLPRDVYDLERAGAFGREKRRAAGFPRHEVEAIGREVISFGEIAARTGLSHVQIRRGLRYLEIDRWRTTMLRPRAEVEGNFQLLTRYAGD